MVSVPIRTCVACRRPKERSRLVRLVGRSGQVQVDPNGSQPGRGAYLCGCQACLDLALGRGGARLRRALRLGEPAAVDAQALRRQWLEVMGSIPRQQWADPEGSARGRISTSGLLPDGSE